MLKTDAETKTMTAVLADIGENSPFCYDCVWNVAVEWDATQDKGKSADNLKIYNNFRGKITTTVRAVLRCSGSVSFFKFRSFLVSYFPF